MSGLIVSSGSFNRIYVKPMVTSLGSAPGSNMRNILTVRAIFHNLRFCWADQTVVREVFVENSPRFLVCHSQVLCSRRTGGSHHKLERPVKTLGLVGMIVRVETRSVELASAPNQE